MGTSLTGLKIKDSYSGLLKTSDNGGLGASAKQLTDGLGTGSPLYLSTTGLGIGADAGIAKVKITKDNTAGNALEISNSGESRSLDINHNADGTGIVDDIVRISNNGSRKFTINSSGNVGIGTGGSAPTTRLDVRNNSNNVLKVTQEDTALSNNTYAFHIDSSAQVSNMTVAGAMAVDVNSGRAFEINGTGNVGIGGVPTEKLHIKGTDQNIFIDAGKLQIAYGSDGYRTDIYTEYSYSYVNSIIESVAGASYEGQILFKTSSNGGASAERMRITSGGFLKASNAGSYLGSTGSYHELRSDSLNNVVAYLTNSNTTDPYGIAIGLTGAAPDNTSNYFIKCHDNAFHRFFVYSNGNVANTNNSYGAISDAKLKENVVDASPKLDDLMQVQVRNYNLIGDNKKQLGVVAQELETIFPSMIDETPDFEEREVELRDENGEIVYETEQVLVSEEVAEVTEEVLHEAIAEEMDEEGNVIVEAQEAWTETIIVTPFQEAVYETVTTDRPVMTTERVDLGTTTKSVKYSVFVPILVKAMQEQQEIINKLEARIAALEAK